MKSYLPAFLRKKMKSSSSSSFNNSDSAQAMETSSSPGFAYTSSTSSSSESHRDVSSDGGWSQSVLKAHKVSNSTEEIVVLKESTGTVEKQFASSSSSHNSNHELEEAFLRFDANRDGKISTLELGSVLRSLGDNPSDEELRLMMKEADRDGDGFIDLQEFILLNSECSPSVSEDLRRAFLVFDTDADGKISVEELYRVLNRLGESCTREDCGLMIQGVDKNGDGFVDFKEFCTMMSMH